MKPIAAAALAFSMLNTAGAAERIRISRAASRPVQSAPAQNFTGTVQVEMLFTPDGGTRTSAGKVRFAPVPAPRGTPIRWARR